MLDHSLHRAFIVADDDINDKEAIIEGILYHLQNCRSLHTVRASLEVIWTLMFLCFLSSLFRSITLPEGLLIEDHSDGPIAPFPDDEGVSAGGVISPPRLSLLPAYVVCHGKFNLVVVFFLVCLSTPFTILLIVAF